MSDLTELIKKFPERKYATSGVTLVVYDESSFADAAYEIEQLWGMSYLRQVVTLVSHKDNPDYKCTGQVFIDPMVLRYKAQWQN